MSSALRRCYLYIYWLVFLNAINTLAEEPDSAVTVRHYYTEPVVITAGKFAVKLSESPYKIEVVDEKKIKASNGFYLADILKNASQVTLRSYGNTPLLQTASINGMSPEHTVILIDGVRINSFQNSLVDLSLINTEFIDRIELISGGASSLYGSNAMGGVVNIITGGRDGKGSGVKAKAEVGYGPFDSRAYLFGIAGQSEEINYRFYLSNRQSGGRYEYLFDDGVSKKRKERENAAYLLRDMGLMFDYMADHSSLIKLTVLYTNQDKELPGIVTGTPSPKTEQPDKALNTILSFDKAISHFSELKFTINYQNTLQKYKTLPFINTFYKNDLATFSGTFQFDADLIKAVAGYDYAHGRMISKELTGTAVRNQHALFFSSSVRLPKGVNLFPSARIDNYSDLGINVITGRAGITYKPFDNGMLFRASIGNNFRAPTFNDLYWKNGGNPNLKPERSMNIEGGIRYSGVVSSLLIGAEAGYNQIKAAEKIVWSPGARLLWSPKNISSSVSKITSFNISADSYESEQLSYGITAGINFNSSVDRGNTLTGGKQLVYVPFTTANTILHIRYSIVTVNIAYNHIGARFADAENLVSMKPVNLIGGNFTVEYPFGDVTASVRFQADNITDNDYQFISGYPMPLRNYSFIATLKFNY